MKRAREAKETHADEHITDEHEQPLPEKQEAALLSLLSHKTLKESALSTGVLKFAVWQRRLTRHDNLPNAITWLAQLCVAGSCVV